MNFFRSPGVIIVLILLIVLLFGSRRLPDLARSVGQSLKIFKSEVKELKDDGKTEPGHTSANPGDGAAGAGTPGSSTMPGATPNGTTTPGTTPNGTTSPQVPGLSDPNHPRG